jgi:hypothetical protein
MSYSSCSHCGGYSANSSSYSALERVINYQHSQHYDSHSDYSLSNSELERSVKSAIPGYISKLYTKNTTAYGNNLYLSNDNITSSYFSTSSFIRPNSPMTRFVGEAVEIEDFVREAFKLTLKEDFPDDISIKLCEKLELKKIHANVGGVWSEGINGFAINRKRSGQGCNIFVLKDELAKVMITLGHEIGHCLSNPLSNIHDEEAKAFAFELAWVETLHKHDIAELSSSLTTTIPARNGLHNVAFDFVRKIIRNGTGALEICAKLVSGELSIKGDLCEA